MDQLKVGSFIAVLRHEAGLTQEALGQKLGGDEQNYLPLRERVLPAGH